MEQRPPKRSQENTYEAITGGCKLDRIVKTSFRNRFRAGSSMPATGFGLG
jgi:hypothetical protein